MKKKIYLAMLAVCFALTASACGDGGAVITDGTKTEGAADGKKAETGTTRLVSVENVEKYITIGEYKGLTLDNTVDAITDDDVQAQIDEDLKDKAEPVSDAAKEGDLVTVNYTGTKDGQTFDGGTANNYDFVIGDGQMFEEFENGVIGMKKGDTKEIKIDFPSDYADETLAGKEVIYKVTVQNVRREGELTDEQCKHCLAATNLGMQYIFVSEKAVSQAKLIERCYISQNERKYYKNIRLEESKLGANKVKLARKQYRGKGRYIDEILV